MLQLLRAAGIAAGIHYPKAIPDQAALHAVTFELADMCMEARRIAGSEISLPIHPYLTGGEVDAVVDAVRSWRVAKAGRGTCATSATERG